MQLPALHIMFTNPIRILLISIVSGCTASAQSSYAPITSAERLHWLVNENSGATGVLEDVVVAVEDTRENSLREAGLGSLWGEDPPDAHTAGMPLVSRIGHVVKMIFLAQNHADNTIPACAHLLAIPGSSFAANSWMPDSQATVHAAAFRSGLWVREPHGRECLEGIPVAPLA
jgi:hypothetical protein